MNKYSAIEKLRAVLSVWAEKRKGGEVCKELAISSGLLSQWQETAMDGMLLALEPKWREAARCPVLSTRVKKLLERKVAEREGRLPKLERRLAKMAGAREAATPE